VVGVQQGMQVLLGGLDLRVPVLHHTLEVTRGRAVRRRGRRTVRRASSMRARISKRGADACPGLGRRLEVDPMVGGVLRFVDSGVWRGA
jgi:hypothetical protein